MNLRSMNPSPPPSAPRARTELANPPDRSDAGAAPAAPGVAETPRGILHTPALASLPKMEVIDYHGEKLKAVIIDNDVWVWVRPMCHAIGVDPRISQERLAAPSRAPWARTKIIPVLDPSGRTYSAFCIDLKSAFDWIEIISAYTYESVPREFRLGALIAIQQYFDGPPFQRAVANFYEAVTRLKRTTSIPVVAMHLGLGPSHFLRMLRLDGIIENASTRPLPSHLIDGHFVVEGRTTRVTGKGMAYLFKRYNYKFVWCYSMDLVGPG